MCVFTHVAAGALAGALSPWAWLAPVAGLGSHVALDVVPHYDIDDMRIEIALAVLVFASLLLLGARSPAIVLGAFFGAAPDIENLLWKLGKIPEERKVFPGHGRLIRHGRPAGPSSLVLQAAGAVAVVAVLAGGVL